MVSVSDVLMGILIVIICVGGLIYYGLYRLSLEIAELKEK